MRTLFLAALLAVSAALTAGHAQASPLNPYTYIFNDSRHPSLLGTQNMYPFPDNPQRVVRRQPRRWR